MWKSIISIALILFSVNLSAQIKKEAPLSEKEKNKRLERQFFVRVGVDLSRFALPLIDEMNPTGWEVNMDAEINYRFFPTLEAGTSKINYQQTEIDYESKGNYMRIGFNYNMLNYKQRFDRNLFFIGARIGFTGYSQQIDKVSLSNDWGNIETSFPLTDLTAQWFEGVIGIKGELVKNLYMGYTIRVKQMLNHTEYNDITPYWVPGYGKGNQVRNLGMSYSIFYAFPIKNPKAELPE
jgi:hypothetical protein